MELLSVTMKTASILLALSAFAETQAQHTTLASYRTPAGSKESTKPSFEPNDKLYSLQAVAEYFSDCRRLFSAKFPRDLPNPAKFSAEVIYPDGLLSTYQKQLKAEKLANSESLATMYSTQIPAKMVSCLGKALKGVLGAHCTDDLLQKLEGSYKIEPESYSDLQGDRLYSNFPYFPTKFRISFRVKGATHSSALFSVAMADATNPEGCTGPDLRTVGDKFDPIYAAWEKSKK